MRSPPTPRLSFLRSAPYPPQKIAEKFPSVSIGSYPNTQREYKLYTTKLCFDGRDESAITAAVAAAREAIPKTFDSLPAEGKTSAEPAVAK